MSRASQVKRKNVEKKKIMQEENKSYRDRLDRIRLADSYVSSQANAMYFLERCNMLADEIAFAEKEGMERIGENVDGQPKTIAFARAEYMLMKNRAIRAARDAYFHKTDLMKKHNFSEEDIKRVEDEYFEKPILRKEYDEEYRVERQVGAVAE